MTDLLPKTQGTFLNHLPSEARTYEPRVVRRFLYFCIPALLIICTLFWFYSRIAMPFLIGAFFAYLLVPVVDHMENRGVNRSIGTLFFLGIVTLLIVGVAIKLGPFIYDQLVLLAHEAPTLVEGFLKNFFAKTREWLRGLGFKDTAYLERAWRGFNVMEQAFGQAQLALGKLYTTGSSIMDAAVSSVLVPFVAFVLIVEKPRISRRIKYIIPRDIRPLSKDLVGALNVSMRAVLRGHIKVALVAAVLYSVGFSAIGLSAGVAIGVAAGICRVVPYLDAVVGIFLGTTFIFTQGGSMTDEFLLLGVIGLVQVLDGAFITPKLIGGRVGLHPLAVVLTVIACGSRFGFWGVLIAIPLAALIKTTFGFFLPIYRESSWFNGKKI